MPIINGIGAKTIGTSRKVKKYLRDRKRMKILILVDNIFEVGKLISMGDWSILDILNLSSWSEESWKIIK